MDKKDTVNKVPIYKLTSKEEVLKYYRKWTENNQYNKDMVEWDYTAPLHAANLLNQYSTDKKIKILDAGCGSGLVGVELQKYGYTKITGVDFSNEMLNLIPNKIYHQLELIDLNQKLKYKDSIFYAVICVGTFTYGHVKDNALNELIRILKKNGLICFTINEGIYKKYQFDKKIEELSNNKLWDIINISKCSYIVNKNIEAWLCIAKKN